MPSNIFTQAAVIAMQRPKGPTSLGEWFQFGVDLAVGMTLSIDILGPFDTVMATADTEVTAAISDRLEYVLSQLGSFDSAYSDAILGAGGWDAIRDTIGGVRIRNQSEDIPVYRYDRKGVPSLVGTLDDGERLGRSWDALEDGDKVILGGPTTLNASASREFDFVVPDGSVGIVTAEWTPASASAATNTVIVSRRIGATISTPAVVSTSAATASTAAQSFMVDEIPPGEYRLAITAGAVNMNNLRVLLGFTR